MVMKKHRLQLSATAPAPVNKRMQQCRVVQWLRRPCFMSAFSPHEMMYIYGIFKEK